MLQRLVKNAFDKSTNLQDVYFDGTIAQWKAIEIGEENDPLLNATIHCTDGDTYGSTEPTSIKLNRTSYIMNKGNTYTLKATVTPDKAEDKTVTWTSSDETVVTVADDGTVTGVGLGKATITAET